MHPALNVLIMVVLAIHFAMPLGAWLMLSGRRDDKAQMWFVSISLFSLSMSMVALRPVLPEYMSFTMAWIMTFTGWLLMVETFRLELNRPPRPWWFTYLLSSLWGVYLLSLEQTGQLKTIGAISYSIIFVVMCVLLSGLLWRMRQMYNSRSTLLMLAAMVLYGSSYTNRLYQYHLNRDNAFLDVLTFSWVSNVVIVATVLGIILLCLGYWGFVLEKASLEKQAALTAQSKAEDSAQAMRQIIEERDQLLILNARVSALSSLSSFSAMLVHDISQPLQALEFGLFDLKRQAVAGRDGASLQPLVNDLMKLSAKAGDMVGSLRSLMRRGQDQVEPMRAGQVLQAILPVFRNEAQQRRIALTYDDQTDEQVQVMGNPAMLQRIVFNLMGNAMDALLSSATANPTIHLHLGIDQQDQKRWVLLRLEDNGPGLPASLFEALGGPAQSTKPDGLGLGLMLTQNMLRLWGGHTVIHNRTASQGTGALIELWLALAPADEANPP